MADRYWVGGTGTWSDAANHWSNVSNGAPNASFLPTSSDNVYFDASSFSSASQTVTIDAAASCNNMNWTGVTNTPSLNGSATLNIYGNLTLVSGMTAPYTGNLDFSSTTTAKTITTAGLSLSCGIRFMSATGGWILQDNIITTGNIYPYFGNINTNSKNINCNYFAANNGTTMTLTLGSSIITCVYCSFSKTNTTFNANASTIKMTGDSRTFTSNGLTFNIVELQGNLQTLTGSNIFNELKLTANKTIKFTAGTTQTITNWTGDGTLGNVITIQSTSAGTFYTINCASGIMTKQYYSIQDCHVGGGAVFKAYLSTDVSGNDGWTIISSGAIPVSTLKNVRFPLRKLGQQFRYVR